MRYGMFLVCLTGTAVSVHAQHAHVGMYNNGVDDVLEIRTGYYGSESNNSINAQRQLMFGDERAHAFGADIVVGGDYDGWYQFGQIANPTSDFYQSTLEGQQDLYYEITIDAVYGSSDAVAALTLGGHGHGELITARTDAIDLLGRSLVVPVGTHRHGYSWFLSEAGTYEITYRAYDLSGDFVSDAQRSTVSYLVTVPAPGIGAMAMFAAFGGLRRRR
ncbi:MAG: hypothetical protein AAGB34_01565 [Planctomycetota bacterium]